MENNPRTIEVEIEEEEEIEEEIEVDSDEDEKKDNQNEEQKDADDNNNLEYMRTILAALAVIHEDEEGNCEFEALEGQKSIGKVMVKYGYTKPDSLQLLALACKMGILEKTGEVYQFKNDEFFEYFKNYAITSGIDDILED